LLSFSAKRAPARQWLFCPWENESLSPFLAIDSQAIGVENVFWLSKPAIVALVKKRRSIRKWNREKRRGGAMSFSKFFGTVLVAFFATAAVWANDELSESKETSMSSKEASVPKTKSEFYLSQIAMAQEKLDEAKKKGVMKQEEIDTWQQRLDQAREAVEASEIKSQSLRKELHEIEENVLFAQSSDSEVVRSQAAVDQAKEKLERIIQRVVSSPAYLKRIKRVEAVENAGHLRSEVRKAMLESNPEYQKALSEYGAAKKDLQKKRMEVLGQSQAWQTASNAIREAEVKEKKVRELSSW
jgi:hypothetical protein